MLERAAFKVADAPPPPLTLQVDACALLAELRPAAAEVRALQEAGVEDAPQASLRALCVIVAWAERAPVLLRALPPLREAMRLLDGTSTAHLWLGLGLRLRLGLGLGVRVRG